MRAVLGLSVNQAAIHAVLVERGTIQWAGHAPYQGEEDLAEVIARLAGESGKRVRAVRVVLERDVVQLRTVTPLPPLTPAKLQRYVALEAPRLFRKNGAPLATDGVAVTAEASTRVLWAAAAPEPLLHRILDGAAQAGLWVETIGPAADVLPAALALRAVGDAAFASGSTTEVLSVGAEGPWRSRIVRETPAAAARVWISALAQLDQEAPAFAAAYAVTRRRPRLELWPADARMARARDVRRRLVRVALVGIACWLLAVGVYVARLLVMLHAANAYLAGVSVEVDSALAARRDLDAARATLATIAAAEGQRSRHLELLTVVSTALGDSAYLVTLQVTADGTVRFSGYAPSAATVLAALDRAGAIAHPRFEGPVTRETTAAQRQLDRFAVVAERAGAP